MQAQELRARLSNLVKNLSNNTISTMETLQLELQDILQTYRRAAQVPRANQEVTLRNLLKPNPTVEDRPLIGPEGGYSSLSYTLLKFAADGNRIRTARYILVGCTSRGGGV